MKTILLMIGMFLLIIVSFLIIWFMTADRAGNEEALLPKSSIEYVGTDREAIYNQLFYLLF